MDGYTSSGSPARQVMPGMGSAQTRGTQRPSAFGLYISAGKQSLQKLVLPSQRWHQGTFCGSGFCGAHLLHAVLAAFRPKPVTQRSQSLRGWLLHEAHFAMLHCKGRGGAAKVNMTWTGRYE